MLMMMCVRMRRTKNVIKEFESISEASSELNISPDYIRRVCGGVRKQTGGFAWSWKN